MSSQSLAVVPQFSQEQIDIIRSQVAPKGTTNDELAMFMQYCQRTGLDPFARQIYLSERRSQVNGQWVVTRKPETTIDGFRVIAERAGKYAGQLGPFWCGADGEWKDVWTPQEPPVAARVGILRHDFKEPLWAVALYDEYVQTAGTEKRPNSMWTKMPANQLAKCAESLALRRAFPRELSGLYTREEMPTEQHEAKEAQKDYLAEKGLTPYVKPDVRKSEQNIKDLIIEGAQMIDTPRAPDAFPQGAKTIEMRHASQVAEADAQLKDVAKPAKKKAKGFVSFDVLKHFGIVKQEMLEDFGDDTAYYSIITGVYGYKHANEIRDNDQAREIYKALGNERNRLKQEKELLGTLEHASEVLGARVFGDLLGTYGAEKVTDVMAMTGDALAVLLKALKDCVDAKNVGGAA